MKKKIVLLSILTINMIATEMTLCEYYENECAKRIEKYCGPLVSEGNNSIDNNSTKEK